MPTYEYKCDACGHAFEAFHSMTAAPIRKCPACKKLKVKRLIGTGAGLIFKGSGFYITDYRDKSYTDKAKAESGSGSTTDGAAAATTGGEGKGASTDSKPSTTAAKSDAKATPSTSSTNASPSAAKAAGKKQK
jgi:putative FmdB family regulatory protein